MPIEQFVELTAFACCGGYRGLDFSGLLDRPDQQSVLLRTARGLSSARLELAEQLINDSESCRESITHFLTQCGTCSSTTCGDSWSRR